ncbi:hypothetical protein D5073_21040 [Pectobacterium versatile]|uniref:restriction endonuclease n=1 Tax=Pectobacterium versatile TaxID=2488639 RepID=UPI000B7BECC0|nr:restriction endonuclease [Pectobacterium versatile]ASN85125.1 Hypothetical protein SCC1_1687 [Pectobacterium versatile]MBQ4765417.1 hypothetical protein [Pectobacterium versatile]RJL48220.1 hypothetical protein D5073_21040 [Pectobacterium versatile]RJL57019.1 hypothetical protein D5076_14375 [Pectobacterium versatile]RJL60434.1 hypothetical protein D5080_15985 [Pectobacterium versatile]
MAALDLKEISPAHEGLERDQFELFARDFLLAQGFVVVSDPDRGPDGGRDLIVEEERFGPGGKNTIRWLVSCKHKAHSGSSVSPSDDTNIRDRLETHSCQGFIAFYSTIPSSGLAQTLTALRPNYEYIQYDCEAIERQLLENPRGRGLAARYTPVSFNKWMIASQMVHTPTVINDPQHSINHFFLRHPHVNLTDALIEASARNVPLFIVIYGHEHPSNSRIEYSLGYFMEYHTTKKLVDQNFVAAVVPNLTPDVIALVPPDDPLENCLCIVMQPNGNIIRREGVYANPDEGMKRVRAVITLLGL